MVEMERTRWSFQKNQRGSKRRIFKYNSSFFQNHLEDKSQNNLTVETILFTFFKNVFDGKNKQKKNVISICNTLKKSRTF
ncbi:hypothetical protein YC2023_060169 [Brassica napus]